MRTMVISKKLLIEYIIIALPKKSVKKRSKKLSKACGIGYKQIVCQTSIPLREATANEAQ